MLFTMDFFPSLNDTASGGTAPHWGAAPWPHQGIPQYVPISNFSNVGRDVVECAVATLWNEICTDIPLSFSESLDLAIQLLDESEVRGHKIHIEVATSVATLWNEIYTDIPLSFSESLLTLPSSCLTSQRSYKIHIEVATSVATLWN